MKKFFVKPEDREGEKFVVKGENFVHMRKVLRTEVGEQVELLAGDGKVYLCEVSEILEGKARVRILQDRENLADPKLNITVYQALPKGDKFEVLLQKLSELGVKKLVPFESEFTIKKPKDKAERYKKLAEEACKQCGRSLPLEVAECISFKAMLKEISKTEKTFFAYEIELDGSLSVKDMLEELKEARDIALIVGSEGGFSQREAESILEAGASAVSLGKRILRCETACVAMTALVSLYLEN